MKQITYLRRFAVPLTLYMLLALLAAIWGSSFYFIHILVEPFGPWGVAWLRCTAGAIVLGLALLIRRPPLLHVRHVPWLKLIAVGLFNSAVPWSLIAFSQTMLSSGMASVLNAFTPIWAVLIGVIGFRSKAGLYQWLGVIVGFIGMIILLEIDVGTLTLGHPLAMGAMMLATLMFGFGAHLSKRYFQQISVYWTAFVTLASGSVLSGAFVLASPSFPTGALLRADWGIVIAIVGLGVFGSGVAYLVYYTLLQKGSAEFTTTVTYLVPLFAIFWGYVLLDEPISGTLLGGLAFILAGVYASGRKRRQQAKPAQTAVTNEA